MLVKLCLWILLKAGYEIRDPQTNRTLWRWNGKFYSALVYVLDDDQENELKSTRLKDVLKGDE